MAYGDLLRTLYSKQTGGQPAVSMPNSPIEEAQDVLRSGQVGSVPPAGLGQLLNDTNTQMGGVTPAVPTSLTTSTTPMKSALSSIDFMAPVTKDPTKPQTGVPVISTSPFSSLVNTTVNAPATSTVAPASGTYTPQTGWTPAGTTSVTTNTGVGASSIDSIPASLYSFNDGLDSYRRDYLANNPDVLAAFLRGDLNNTFFNNDPLMHYMYQGQFETTGGTGNQRWRPDLSRAPLHDELAYLAQYPDIARSISLGGNPYGIGQPGRSNLRQHWDAERAQYGPWYTIQNPYIANRSSTTPVPPTSPTPTPAPASPTPTTVPTSTATPTAASDTWASTANANANRTVAPTNNIILTGADALDQNTPYLTLPNGLVAPAWNDIAYLNVGGYTVPFNVPAMSNLTNYGSALGYNPLNNSTPLPAGVYGGDTMNGMSVTTPDGRTIPLASNEAYQIFSGGQSTLSWDDVRTLAYERSQGTLQPTGGYTFQSGAVVPIYGTPTTITNANAQGVAADNLESPDVLPPEFLQAAQDLIKEYTRTQQQIGNMIPMFSESLRTALTNPGESPALQGLEESLERRMFGSQGYYPTSGYYDANGQFQALGEGEEPPAGYQKTYGGAFHPLGEGETPPPGMESTWENGLWQEQILPQVLQRASTVGAPMGTTLNDILRNASLYSMEMQTKPYETGANAFQMALSMIPGMMTLPSQMAQGVFSTTGQVTDATNALLYAPIQQALAALGLVPTSAPIVTQDADVRTNSSNAGIGQLLGAIIGAL